MKTKIIVSAIALALTSASAFATTTQSTEGTIKFTGAIKEVSCDITVDGTDFNNAEINLDNAYKTDLSETAGVKGKSFALELKGCKVILPGATNPMFGDDSTVTVNWDNAGFLANGYLENTLNAANASGAYLALFNGANVTDKTALVVPGTDTGAVTKDISNGNAKFEYTVNYVTDDVAAVEAGQIVSQATYKLTYN